MNPALADTGPDGGGRAVTLTVGAADGTTRELTVRGVIAYKPPSPSLLQTSEWNVWTDTPDLDEGERVDEVSTAAPDLRWTVIRSERTGSALYGVNGSDLTRYQLVIADGLVMTEFDPRDFDARDFG